MLSIISPSVLLNHHFRQVETHMDVFLMYIVFFAGDGKGQRLENYRSEDKDERDSSHIYAMLPFTASPLIKALVLS